MTKHFITMLFVALAIVVPASSATAQSWETGDTITVPAVNADIRKLALSRSAANWFRLNRVRFLRDFGNMPGKLHRLPKKVL